jgi:inactive STAND
MSKYSTAKVREVLEAAFDANEIRKFAESEYKEVAENLPDTVDRKTFIQNLVESCTNLDELVRKAVDNIEERSPKKYLDVKRILAGKAETAVIGKNELFSSLKRINFGSQSTIGTEVSEQYRVASFWIHGDLMSGQDMLYKLLIDKIGGSSKVCPIDMRSNDSTQTAESAWAKIAAFFNIAVNEHTKIIEEIAGVATRENVVIILRGASNMVDLSKWTQEFWKSLVEATMSAMDDSSSGFLVLFLIDYLNSELAPPQLTEAQNKLKAYHKNLGLKWNPKKFMAYRPICLPVSEPFDDAVLDEWFRVSGLPVSLTGQLKKSRPTYKDRRPLCMYAEIVKTCNQNWDEISSWLK